MIYDFSGFGIFGFFGLLIFYIKKPPPAEARGGHPKNQILRILKSVLGNAHCS